MTKAEVNKLLAMMRANYSSAFKNMNQQDKYLLLNTWAFTLRDLDANVVMIAAMKLISVSKWLPTVAEIREKCKTMYYEAAYIDDERRARMSKAELAAYDAIARNTAHLRAEDSAELSLSAMVDDPDIAALAIGKMDMLDDGDERKKGAEQ